LNYFILINYRPNVPKGYSTKVAIVAAFRVCELFWTFIEPDYRKF